MYLTNIYPASWNLLPWMNGKENISWNRLRRTFFTTPHSVEKSAKELLRFLRKKEHFFIKSTQNWTMYLLISLNQLVCVLFFFLISRKKLTRSNFIDYYGNLLSLMHFRQKFRESNILTVSGVTRIFVSLRLNILLPIITLAKFESYPNITGALAP